MSACLRRLRDGGVTESQRIVVVDAWAFDDGFCVIYIWDDSERLLGLRVTRETQQVSGAPFWYQHWQTSTYPDATEEEFGIEIADLAIAEPGPGGVELLDVDGVGWWGQQPLPGVRP